MGSALGAAVVLNGFLSMTLFVAIGIGLALPYLMLSLNHRLLSALPKPGPWMVRLKEFMAFPLFATVLWLLWVLGSQVGEGAWLLAGSILLGISFAIWIGRKQRTLALLVAFTVAVLGGIAFTNLVRDAGHIVPVGDWANFTATTDEEIAQRRSQGQSVLVDYTATWCITCQWNKKAVLESDDARALFQTHNTWLVRADWTLQDSAVTKSLARFGRNSVPLYVFYPPKGEPKILPQILTYSILEQIYVD